MSSNSVHKTLAAQILNASSLRLHPDFETLDPNSKTWDVINVEVVDGVERYAQIYYDQTSAYAHHLLLRGTIVDLVDEKIVCPGLGYTPKIRVPYGFNFFNGSRLTDEFGRTIEVTSDCVFTKGVEGPAISVWKRNGKVYVSTHKKISYVNSKWPRGAGRQKTYPEMLAELTDPEFNFDSFFGPDDESVHNFVLCHPDVLFATHADPNQIKGLYYIGSTAGAPRAFTGVKVVEKIDSFVEVGNFLRYGYSPSDQIISAVQSGFPRILTPGEFVMMTKYADFELDNGQIVKLPVGVYRLESEAYSFRVGLRMKHTDLRVIDTEPLMTIEPNTTLAYFAYQDSSLYKNLGSYKLPLLKYAPETHIKNVMMLPGHKWNIRSVPSLRSVNDYKYNSWLVFLMCAPLTERELIFNLRVNHQEIQSSTATLILTPPEGLEVPRRAKEILSQATEWSVKNKSSVALEVENIVKREYGRSLYKLHKELTRPPRPAPVVAPAV